MASIAETCISEDCIHIYIYIYIYALYVQIVGFNMKPNIKTRFAIYRL